MAATKKITAAQMIAVARSQIGYIEGPNNYNKYGRDYGWNYVAWCNQFVWWVFWKAGGAYATLKTAYTPSGLAWYQARGRVDRGKNPKVGDVVFVYTYTRDVVGHVGIVEKVNGDGTVTTIEGNTNNTGSSQGIGVFRLRRPINSRLYFCHPDYAVKAAPKPPSKPVPSKPVTSTATIKIKSGDTLSKIATKYKVSVKQLQTWNKISNPNKISVGQTIRVKAPTGAPAPKKKVAYLVTAKALNGRDKNGKVKFSRKKGFQVNVVGSVTKAFPKYGIPKAIKFMVSDYGTLYAAAYLRKK